MRRLAKANREREVLEHVVASLGTGRICSVRGCPATLSSYASSCLVFTGQVPADVVHCMGVDTVRAAVRDAKIALDRGPC